MRQRARVQGPQTTLAAVWFAGLLQVQGTWESLEDDLSLCFRWAIGKLLYYLLVIVNGVVWVIELLTSDRKCKMG